MCPSHLPSLPGEVIYLIMKPWNFRPYNWSFASCNDGGARCIWPRVEMVGALRCRFSWDMLDSLQSKKHFPPEETSRKIHQYPSISIINPFIPVNIYAIYLVLNGWWIHKFSATASPHGVPEAWTAPIWETSQWAAIALTLGVVDQLVGCWSSYPTRFSCGWLNLVDE